MNQSNPARPPLSITRAGIFGTLLVLVVAALCVRFGIWQLSRLSQRQARNAVLAQRAKEPPIPFTQLPRDTTGLVFRRVTVEGTFDHEHTFVLASRSLRGVPGVHVFTPVRSASGGTAVLVNRGWSPAADGATINLDSLRSADSVRVTGIVLPFPTPRTTSPQRPDTFRTLRFEVDVVGLERELPYRVLPYHVQALPDGPTNSFPIRLQPPPVNNGPHLGYAIQWFSFAIIAIGGWLALVMRKTRAV